MFSLGTAIIPDPNTGVAKMPRIPSSVNRSSLTARKRKEQGQLVWFLTCFGVVIPSCSRCRKKGLECLTNSRCSDHCGEYVKANYFYDVFGLLVPKLERMMVEERKLQADLEAA